MRDSSGSHERHVVLSRADLIGFQYGMLRDFEDEVVRLTGAERAPMPVRKLHSVLDRRVAQGTRFARLRRLIPPVRTAAIECDVLWVPLMSPEEFSLDLYRGWDDGARTKILYLFDTFEAQLPSLRRVAKATRWTAAITAFHGAVPFLERATGIRWASVDQGATAARFLPVPPAERVIGVSSYGRRDPRVHAAIRQWAARRGIYYDYTVAATVQAAHDPREIYRQYAWHVAHSVFTIAWPVEHTNPGRAKTFSPVTCRWFEAALAGTVIVGRPPTEPKFRDLLEGAVVDLDPAAPNLEASLDALWERRDELLARAAELRARRMSHWTWEARIQEMLQIARG